MWQRDSSRHNQPPNIEMKALEILELKGLVLTAADGSAAPDQWNFGFGEGCWLNLGCTWRIILDDEVVLAKGDQSATAHEWT